MNIAFAALAEAANVAENGNLNVLGVFDTIMAQQLPTRYPAVTLAFRLRYEYEDVGNHRLKIVLLDADSQTLWGAEAMIAVAPMQPGRFAHDSQLVAFRDLVLPREGRYKFRILIDDDPPHDVVFQVLQGEEPTA